MLSVITDGDIVLLCLVGSPLSVEGSVVFTYVNEHLFELGNAIGISVNRDATEFADKGLAVIKGDEAKIADEGNTRISAVEANVLETGGAGIRVVNRIKFHFPVSECYNRVDNRI